MRNKWWLFVLGIIALGVIGYFYVFQEHRDIQSEVAEYKLSATILLSDFQGNPEESTRNYLNKTLQIDGIVTQSDSLTLVLDHGIFFALSEKQLHPIGTTVIMKGRCIGYDDLLGEVKIDQAHSIIIKP